MPNSVSVSVFTAGSNLKAQFGVETLKNHESCEFIRVLEMDSTSMSSKLLLAAGANHSVVSIQNSFTIWVAGHNLNGQLGCGIAMGDQVSSWKKLVFPEFRIRDLVCGWDTSFLISTCGKVQAAGSNRFGLLGLHERKDYCEWAPTISTLDLEIIKIACGWRHTLFLSADGSVHACGLLDKCRLDSVISDTVDNYCPKRLNFKEKVIDIACGMYHSVFLDCLNQITVLGRDKHHILGFERSIQKSITAQDPPISVYSGWSTAAFKTKSGLLYSWGRGDLGQLGSSTEPIKASPFPSQISFSEDAKIVAVSMGSESTLLLLDNGRILAFGFNDHGSLGLGHTENIYTPTQISNLKCNSIAAGFGHSLVSGNNNIH